MAPARQSARLAFDDHPLFRAPPSLSMTERIKWLPLASDPVAFNSFADDVSWPTDAWHFVDVWGLDEELLGTPVSSHSPDMAARRALTIARSPEAFVPSPVKAVLLLFPTGEAMNKLRKSEEATDGSILPTGPEDAILWIPQTVRLDALLSLPLHIPLITERLLLR